jgi:6-phosphogluconolactonase
MSTPEIKVLANPTGVAHDAAERLLELSETAIELNGRFSMALSGGSTPKGLYQLLASPDFAPHVDWPSVDIFFADERCVPPDQLDSNYRMARETLLSKVPIPGDNVYRMHGEASDPNEAAKEYGLILKEKFGESGAIDLALLGMGPDGHTASLFPGTAALNETKHRCVANLVPQLNAWRLTLTAPFINRASNVIVLVTGAEKAQRVAEVLEGEPDPQRLPIQLIHPDSGRMTWLLDAAAAGMGEE